MTRPLHSPVVGSAGLSCQLLQRNGLLSKEKGCLVQHQWHHLSLVDLPGAHTDAGSSDAAQVHQDQLPGTVLN